MDALCEMSLQLVHNIPRLKLDVLSHHMRMLWQNSPTSSIYALQALFIELCVCGKLGFFDKPLPKAEPQENSALFETTEKSKNSMHEKAPEIHNKTWLSTWLLVCSQMASLWWLLKVKSTDFIFITKKNPLQFFLNYAFITALLTMQMFGTVAGCKSRDGKRYFFLDFLA